jgi:arginase
VLLSGNCTTIPGVLAGMTGSGRRLGLVWLDAHGDVNTPETDPFGFLDGQGLAIAVGRGPLLALERVADVVATAG